MPPESPLGAHPGQQPIFDDQGSLYGTTRNVELTVRGPSLKASLTAASRSTQPEAPKRSTTPDKRTTMPIRRRGIRTKRIRSRRRLVAVDRTRRAAHERVREQRRLSVNPLLTTRADESQRPSFLNYHVLSRRLRFAASISACVRSFASFTTEPVFSLGVISSPSNLRRAFSASASERWWPSWIMSVTSSTVFFIASLTLSRGSLLILYFLNSSQRTPTALKVPQQQGR